MYWSTILIRAGLDSSDILRGLQKGFGVVMTSPCNPLVDDMFRLPYPDGLQVMMHGRSLTIRLKEVSIRNLQSAKLANVVVVYDSGHSGQSGLSLRARVFHLSAGLCHVGITTLCSYTRACIPRHRTLETLSHAIYVAAITDRHDVTMYMAFDGRGMYVSNYLVKKALLI